MPNKHLFYYMKNCLYVGSFNPITKSHLNIPLDLLKDKTIDNLYFLPVNSQKKNLESINNRINMINLVIKEKMNVINIYNYNIAGIFNYQVLNKIKLDINITHILMGSDLFLKFSTFSNYIEILKKYNLIIVKRNNYEIDDLINNKYYNYKNKILIINKKYTSSSTKARESLNNKKNIYLDKKVLDYIKENNLYN